MMFHDNNELQKYVEENYLDVSDSCIDAEHFNIDCPQCGVVRGFQVIQRGYATKTSEEYNGYNIDLSAPGSIYFHCPVCGLYKLWIIFAFTRRVDVEGGTTNETKIYRVASIPNDGIEDIKELPENPKSLRKAYKEAIKAMDAGAYMAAAAMFRRALQVITRDILKAKRGNLANELKEIVGKTYEGVTLTNNFQENGYVLKEASNQAAHPDADEDLLTFSAKDANDLKDIFMELVAELFIVPAAIKKTREDFLKRRKIKSSK